MNARLESLSEDVLEAHQRQTTDDAAAITAVKLRIANRRKDLKTAIARRVQDFQSELTAIRDDSPLALNFSRDESDHYLPEDGSGTDELFQDVYNLSKRLKTVANEGHRISERVESFRDELHSLEEERIYEISDGTNVAYSEGPDPDLDNFAERALENLYQGPQDATCNYRPQMTIRPTVEELTPGVSLSDPATVNDKPGRSLYIGTRALFTLPNGEEGVYEVVDLPRTMRRSDLTLRQRLANRSSRNPSGLITTALATERSCALGSRAALHCAALPSPQPTNTSN